MSNINVYEVINSANSFANEMIKTNLHRHPVSSEEKLKIHSEEILSTNQGRTYVDNMVLGAIIAYHNQLREVLLKSGIDIGECVVD